MTILELALGVGFGCLGATITTSALQYGIDRLNHARHEKRELDRFNEMVAKLKDYSEETAKAAEEAKKPTTRRKKTGDA